MANLYIIRGVPGSGKTTLAKKMIACEMADYSIEADFFMTDEKGRYSFTPSKLTDCHQKCQDAIHKSLVAGNNCVVSNTFTRKWEMKPYIDMAKAGNHKITIIVCQGDFQNVHGVPDAKVLEMKERFEY